MINKLLIALLLFVSPSFGQDYLRPKPRPKPIQPVCHMSSLVATLSDSWVIFYDGSYHVEAGFGGFDPYWIAGVQAGGGASSHLQSIIQFDTSIGADAVIDSVSLSRNIDIPVVGASTHLEYYLGTWAATPPAADAATFTGGTLAGSEALVEASTPGVEVVTLSGSGINKTGITSLRIDSTDGGSGLNDDFVLFNDVILTIVYHTAIRHCGPNQIMFCS